MRHLTPGPQWGMQTTPTSQSPATHSFYTISALDTPPGANGSTRCSPCHLYLSLFPKCQRQLHPITLLEITGSDQDLMHWGTELLPTQLRHSAQNPQILNPAPQNGMAAEDAPCLPQAAGSHAFISTRVAKHHSRAGADKGSAGKTPRRGWRCQAHAVGGTGNPPITAGASAGLRLQVPITPGEVSTQPGALSTPVFAQGSPGLAERGVWVPGRPSSRCKEQHKAGFIPAFGLPQAPLSTRQVSCVPPSPGQTQPRCQCKPCPHKQLPGKSGELFQAKQTVHPS